MIGREPLLIIGAVDTALITVQASALHMSTLAHVLIGAGVQVCAFLIGRSQVTPTVQPLP